MSIALMITAKGKEEMLEFLPVATEDTFRRVWLPICGELGLNYVPAFESGMAITDEVFDDVIGELKQLNNFIRSRELTFEDCRNLDERVQMILSKILAYKENVNVSIWIG